MACQPILQLMRLQINSLSVRLMWLRLIYTFSDKCSISSCTVRCRPLSTYLAGRFDDLNSILIFELQFTSSFLNILQLFIPISAKLISPQHYCSLFNFQLKGNLLAATLSFDHEHYLTPNNHSLLRQSRMNDLLNRIALTLVKLNFGCASCSYPIGKLS